LRALSVGCRYINDRGPEEPLDEYIARQDLVGLQDALVEMKKRFFLILQTAPLDALYTESLTVNLQRLHNDLIALVLLSLSLAFSLFLSRSHVYILKSFPPPPTDDGRQEADSNERWGAR